MNLNPGRELKTATYSFLEAIDRKDKEQSTSVYYRILYPSASVRRKGLVRGGSWIEYALLLLINREDD